MSDMFNQQTHFLTSRKLKVLNKLYCYFALIMEFCYDCVDNLYKYLYMFCHSFCSLA